MTRPDTQDDVFAGQVPCDGSGRHPSHCYGFDTKTEFWGQFWGPRLAVAAAEYWTQEDRSMAALTASTITGRSRSTVLRTIAGSTRR